jgi:hypothetical protein
VATRAWRNPAEAWRIALFDSRASISRGVTTVS